MQSKRLITLKTLTLVLTLFISTLTSKVKSQIVTNEVPPSFNLTTNNQLVYKKAINNSIEVSKPDIEQLLKEDKEDLKYGKTWRFGKAIDTVFSLKNAGVWKHFNNGKSMWHLTIIANGAKSINLNFDTFKLSSSAKLFIYNETHDDILGALTDFNNAKNGTMATRPIRGDRLELELWVNTAEINSTEIVCGQVVYGYKDIFNKAEKSFGNSGNCNVNVNCKEGKAWQDVKRSVVMILTSNNTRICTGTLLNNTAEDLTPYVLTAEHCEFSTSNIFVFNYESSNCSPSIDGSLSKSIFGATIVANNFTSDFLLYKLSSIPPPSYNVYYSGWSRLSNPGQYASCIHHPNGDVKKISIAKDKLQSAVYGSGNVEYHWRVKSWLKGTTEPGSSGSPLFNEKQHVIGQLHGGSASCSNKVGSDYYGKFSKSWNNNIDSSKSLIYWLDPLNTDSLYIDGLNPNSAANNLDLAILYAYNLKNYYCDSIKFDIILKNLGNDTINSYMIKVFNDSLILDSIHVFKPLLKSKTSKVALNAGILSHGLHNLSVLISEVNGIYDQNLKNDTIHKQVQFNSKPINLYLKLKTDNFGDETTWNLKPDKSPTSTIYDKGPYSQKNGGNTYLDTLCLYEGCFTLTISDSENDGFNGIYGNGYLLLTNEEDTLIFENNFKSGSKSFTFCLKDTSTFIYEKNIISNEINLYPNPAKAGSKVFLLLPNNTNQKYKVVLIDGRGKEIIEYKNLSNSLTIPHYLSKGLYFLRIENNNSMKNVVYKKILVH